MPEAIEVRDALDAVRVLEERLSRVDLRGVRGRLEEEGLLHRLPGGARLPGASYAVDSAFPSTPVTLLGASLALVAVAAVDSRGGRTVRRWLLLEVFGELDGDYVTGFARLQERRLATSLEDAELVLLDGELVPRPGRSSVWAAVGEENRRLLALPERGTAVAGVLKRSYSRGIASRIGVPVSDRVLATAVLERGEALIAPHSREDLRSRGCVEALYKPLRGPGAAVKAEACCPRDGVDCLELVDALANEAGATGFPWMLDLVDALVKREVSSMTAVEAALLSRLARRRSLHVGYAANPQERRRGRSGGV